MMRREREITDEAGLRHVLDTAQVLYLALTDDDQPYVVPLTYGYTWQDGQLTLYMHGARTGYKYDLLAKNPKVSFAMDCDRQPFSGDVACKYGLAYASLCGKGTASLVTDPAEKCRALTLLMRTQAGEEFEFTDKLAAVVNVIRLDVSEFTGKHRPLPESAR